MKEFTCILEIYEDNEIKYLSATFKGGSMSLPKQEDMDDRDDIVEKAKGAFPQHEILDLIGVAYEGDVVWMDI